MTPDTASNIKVGIIGCGLIGNKRLQALPKSSVVAACDPVLSRAVELAAKAGAQCLATGNLDEFLSCDLDAVMIATPNSHLAPCAETCIRAGKHVLIEKPVGISVAELKSLTALAQQFGVTVRAGYNHRYHPAIQKARSIVDSGQIGPLLFVRGRYGHGGRLGYDREWRANPALSGGGELIDQGVHLIDLAGWFLGSWQSIAGHATTYFWDMPVDDNAFLLLRNDEGKTASLHVSCTEWKNLFSFEIYGRNGKLHIEGLGGSYGVERLYHYQMLPEMGPPDTVIYEYPRGDDSWRLETAEFLEDIRCGRESVPGLAQATATLQVVEEIYRQSNLPKS